MINVYAAAISLIQNNCSFLREKLQSYELSDLNDVDFCAITKYTPYMLQFAVRHVNITGYTGEINFPEMRSIRTSTRKSTNLKIC